MSQFHIARFKKVDELPEYLLCCSKQKEALQKYSGMLMLVDVHDIITLPAACIFCFAGCFKGVRETSGIKVVRNDSNSSRINQYLTIDCVEISEGIYEGGPLNVGSTISSNKISSS